jgi:TetR/AcrR family transcriptional regulator
MREQRQREVADFKRQLLRDAAREVFAEVGLADASVRRITRSAGYTTSALYTYFGSKEELYGDLLRSSMEDLLGVLRVAREGTDDGDEAQRVLHALLEFYLDRPRDFDLSFHLHGGARRTGLTPELDRELNQQMLGIVDFVGDALVASGRATPAGAPSAAAAALASVFGLVLMANTGRLSLMGADARSLLRRQLDHHGTPGGDAAPSRPAPRRN